MKMNASSRYKRAIVAGAVLAYGSLASSTIVNAADPKAALLNIGDPAPVLHPAKWLKGEAIPEFQKGHVYVVEFWATWCGPCKANIPRLTEMAKKYKGKAEIIGVDIWESPDPTIKTLPKVEKFVKTEGAQMDYHIAADETNNRVADAWMKAAGLAGIPSSFIIGRDGRIAWIGNPATGMDAALQQVVNGKFDVATARNTRNKETGPRQAITDAFAAKDYTTALKLINEAVAKDPASERGYVYDRFHALAHTDLPEFEKRAKDLLSSSDGDVGMYQMLTSIGASDKDLSPEAYKFTQGLVAEALTKKDREYMFLAIGAAIDTHLGDRAAAIESQTAAIKAGEADSHCPPEFLTFMRNNLAKLKAGTATD